jgi:hypothetical protein
MLHRKRWRAHELARALMSGDDPFFDRLLMCFWHSVIDVLNYHDLGAKKKK